MGVRFSPALRGMVLGYSANTGRQVAMGVRFSPICSWLLSQNTYTGKDYERVGGEPTWATENARHPSGTRGAGTSGRRFIQ